MENKYYPATFDDCIHLMEYEMCNWFYKGVNGEDIFTWKDNPERETYPIWTPLILNLEDNTTFVDHRTSFNRFCFHVGNSTARVKYLDKEDIESLGYSLSKEDDSYKEFLKVGEFYKYYIVICPIFSKNLGVYINILTNQNTDQTIRFSGFIKNKLELSKLLKQLDIL